jgi:hypothetical protein
MLTAVMSPQELRKHIADRLLAVEARKEQAFRAYATGIGLQLEPELPMTDEHFTYLLNTTCYEVMQAARAGTRGYESVRRNYAEAIEHCRPLLREVVAEGRARGLKDPELRHWTYLMMTPFTQGCERPTEAEWENVRAKEWWNASKACKEVESAWRWATPSERRMIVAWINEQPIGEEVDLPLWREPDR